MTLSQYHLIQTIKPEFKLRYVQPNNGAPGSGTGIQLLIDGQITFAQSSFAQSSRPVTDQELNRAQQQAQLNCLCKTFWVVNRLVPKWSLCLRPPKP